MGDRADLPGLTFNEARAIAENVFAAGAENGFPPLAAAVIDVSGSVRVLHRSDGAAPITSVVALAKARTALRTLMSSADAGHLPEEILSPARMLYHGDVVGRAGGLLAIRDGIVQGAVGVSGAASDQDEEAGAAALRQWAEASPRS